MHTTKGKKRKRQGRQEGTQEGDKRRDKKDIHEEVLEAADIAQERRHGEATNGRHAIPQDILRKHCEPLAVPAWRTGRQREPKGGDANGDNTLNESHDLE